VIKAGGPGSGAALRGVRLLDTWLGVEDGKITITEALVSGGAVAAVATAAHGDPGQVRLGLHLAPVRDRLLHARAPVLDLRPDDDYQNNDMYFSFDRFSFLKLSRPYHFNSYTIELQAICHALPKLVAWPIILSRYQLK
jgi:hypothetical protein